MQHEPKNGTLCVRYYTAIGRTGAWNEPEWRNLLDQWCDSASGLTQQKQLGHREHAATSYRPQLLHRDCQPCTDIKNSNQCISCIWEDKTLWLVLYKLHKIGYRTPALKNGQNILDIFYWSFYNKFIMPHESTEIFSNSCPIQECFCLHGTKIDVTMAVTNSNLINFCLDGCPHKPRKWRLHAARLTINLSTFKHIGFCTVVENVIYK